MKSVCCQCGKVYGRKCPGCGLENIVRRLIARKMMLACQDCGEIFEEAEEASSHGYCDDCYKKLK